MFDYYTYAERASLDRGPILRSIALGVALFAVLAIVPYSVARARSDAPLRVCLEEWVPFMMLDNAGEEGDSGITGPAIEAVKTAGRKIGKDLVFTAVPFARCVRDVSIGRFDMIMTVGMGVGDLITSDIPLAFWSIGAVVRKDDEISRFRSMSQFEGRRVLLTHPFEYPNAIMDSQAEWDSLEWIKLNSSGGIQEYSRPLRMVEGGRADVFFDDSFWAQRVIDESRVGVRLLYPPVHTEPTYIGYAPEKAALKKAFDLALSDMIGDGSLDRIYKARMGVRWRELEELAR